MSERKEAIYERFCKKLLLAKGRMRSETLHRTKFNTICWQMLAAET